MNAQDPLYAVIFPEGPSRSQKRQMQIVQAAIQSYATVGADKTTYDQIAKICKISRPLIQHYFADRDAIFEAAIKFIRAKGQAVVSNFLDPEGDPPRQLEAYLRAHFRWQTEVPQHVQVWLLFYYRCAITPRFRKLNHQLVSTGAERIAAILQLGKRPAAAPSPAIRRQARLVQFTLTGALLALMTEVIGDRKRFENQLVEDCLRVAFPET